MGGGDEKAVLSAEEGHAVKGAALRAESVNSDAVQDSTLRADSVKSTVKSGPPGSRGEVAQANVPAYFDPRHSIVRTAGDHTESMLAVIANRYIGANPPQPPVYRVHLEHSFPRLADCRYEMNLKERLPELEDGEFVYVWGKLWSDADSEIPLALSCFGPVTVYVNGVSVFASNLNDDVFPDRKAFFRTGLTAGWNHFLLECTAVGTGCGGIFGTGSVKGAPLHCLAPTAERSGCEGWIYSAPQQSRWALQPEGCGAPEGEAAAHRAEPSQRVCCGEAAEAAEAALAARCAWYPAAGWPDDEAQRGNLARVLGAEPGAKALAWSRLAVSAPGGMNVRLSLRSRDVAALKVYVDGRLAAIQSEESAGLECMLPLSFGSHDLLVEAVCGGPGWGFRLEAAEAVPRVRAGDTGGSSCVLKSSTGTLKLVSPYPVEGQTGPWLYLGPFLQSAAPQPMEAVSMDAPFGEGAEECFWRVDRPGGAVRPYLESALYGRWNYPLGVTLYGLLRTGQALADPHYSAYTRGHIEQCTRLHAYSLWDRSRYGAPGINQQLALMDSLDDCGSFGATMLAAHAEQPLHGATETAAYIARYIHETQSRDEEGALYRTRGTTDFMQGTMWCDDLYMSTPFLSRYYKLTGDTAYLDDAVSQFLHYRNRLLQPELGIMHHVYDYKFSKPNGVAWGRGNGWVLFSLTELLEVLPEQHPQREELLEYYRLLCEGYLRLQDAAGLWHQVLTDPESYAEASCSSMFVYAFARGVRRGWLTEPYPYTGAALRGWTALAEYCIDHQGNVYGVCRGSGYSFNKLYYKEQLTWQLNDTHGIGIVLLAGIEVLELTRGLEAQRI
ncbi:glycoside hydrolase family 88 protein [Paenibacillus sp. FSL R7-0337]|uniref:glycoside hydrolase family 88/105 protein n=1 Tax=Paenibacillus sp. FSL R7-0337 TaxID=1926588 RepID=UPI0009F9B54D|nr:glycoside hydrolase family 88 protein [Paenibacillus sp. FSL R7-0337]